MSQLKDNTTSLQAILDTVNSLPDAGSGGAVETRVIKTAFPCEVCYTNASGDYVVDEKLEQNGSIAVLKNTIVCMDFGDYVHPVYEPDGPLTVLFDNGRISGFPAVYNVEIY